MSALSQRTPFAVDVMSCYPPLWMWQWNRKWFFQYIHSKSTWPVNPCCNITVPPQTLDMPRCFLALTAPVQPSPRFSAVPRHKESGSGGNLRMQLGTRIWLVIQLDHEGSCDMDRILFLPEFTLWQQVALASALRWKPERWAPWI
jgi:hypothetical protein